MTDILMLWGLLRHRRVRFEPLLDLLQIHMRILCPTTVLASSYSSILFNNYKLMMGHMGMAQSFTREGSE